MKKLFAILLTLLLVASFSVTAFATEDFESPTDVGLVHVDYDSWHPGELDDVSEENVPQGTVITFEAPESQYEFLGFNVECEDYVIISGEQYIVGSGTIGTGERPTLVIKVNADIRVTAMYDISGATVPTQPDDEEGDSPQTGDSMLVYCIAGALLFGFVGFAFAGKKLLKKEN